MDSIMVCSGGMDSVTALHYVVKQWRKEPLVLLFDYDQAPLKELECAKWQAASLRLACVTVALPIRERQEKDINNYVPTRNLVFLSIAAALAETHGCEAVYCGFQGDDRVWDCVQPFLD